MNLHISDIFTHIYMTLRLRQAVKTAFTWDSLTSTVEHTYSQKTKDYNKKGGILTYESLDVILVENFIA